MAVEVSTRLFRNDLGFIQPILYVHEKPQNYVTMKLVSDLEAFRFSL
jgi:hypothetical protein